MNKKIYNEGLEKRQKQNVNNDLNEGSNESGNKEYPEDLQEWARDNAYSYFREVIFDEDYIEKVVANNEAVLLMPNNVRYRHYIAVDEEWSRFFLNVSRLRDENSWDYYQLYELNIGGGIYKYSKFGFDSFIKNKPELVNSCSNLPDQLGYFLEFYMEEFVLPYAPYFEKPNFCPDFFNYGLDHS